MAPENNNLRNRIPRQQSDKSRSPPRKANVAKSNAVEATHSTKKRKPSSAYRLIFLTCGLLLSFTANNMVMEHLYKKPSGGAPVSSNETMVAKVVQSLNMMLATGIFNVLLAQVGVIVTQEKASAKMPTSRSLTLAVFTFVSSYASMFALNYIGMPMRVLFKSCKALPVMLAGWALSGRVYKTRKIVAVALICLGTFIFSFTGNSGSKETSMMGVSMLLVSLICDAITATLEDIFMSGHNVGAFTMMYQLHSWRLAIGVALLSFSTFWSSDSPSFLDLWMNGNAFGLVLLGLTGAAGQAFIFMTISEFGALTTSIVGTLRKVVTLVLSIIFFGHTTSALQIGGILVVCVGFAVNLVRPKPKKNETGTDLESLHSSLHEARSDLRSRWSAFAVGDGTDYLQLMGLRVGSLDPALQMQMRIHLDSLRQRNHSLEYEIDQQLAMLANYKKEMLSQRGVLDKKLDQLNSHVEASEAVIRKCIPGLPAGETMLYVVTSSGQYPFAKDAVFRMTTECS